MSPLNSACQVLEILACLCGVLAALIRWKRHPGVSLALLLALVCRMFSPAEMLLRPLLLKQYPAVLLWSMSIYVHISIPLASWILLSVAIFGWRKSATESEYGSRPFQFSLSHLLALMFLVGLLISLLRFLAPRFFALPPAIGMQLTIAALAGLFFGPTLICWLVALRLAWTRHKKHPQVSEFVGLGIGLQLVVVIVGCAALGGPAEWKEIWFQFVAPPAWLASLVVLIVAALGWRTVAPHADVIGPGISSARRLACRTGIVRSRSERTTFLHSAR